MARLSRAKLSAKRTTSVPRQTRCGRRASGSGPALWETYLASSGGALPVSHNAVRDGFAQQRAPTHLRKLGCVEDCEPDGCVAAGWAPLDGAGAAMAMKLPSWAMVLRSGKRRAGSQVCKRKVQRSPGSVGGDGALLERAAP